MLIRAIVSTISIPNHLLRYKAGSATDQSVGGQFWTPIRDSESAGNATFGYGIVSTGGSGNIGMLIDHSSARQNATGVSATGPSGNILLGGSTVWANGAGLTVAGGGAIFSFGNNQLADFGSFSGAALGLK